MAFLSPVPSYLLSVKSSSGQVKVGDFGFLHGWQTWNFVLPRRNLSCTCKLMISSYLDEKYGIVRLSQNRLFSNFDVFIVC